MTTTCRRCGRTIEAREVGNRASTDEPIVRWCHDRSFGTPTMTCPATGATVHEPELDR